MGVRYRFSHRRRDAAYVGHPDDGPPRARTVALLRAQDPVAPGCCAALGPARAHPPRRTSVPDRVAASMGSVACGRRPLVVAVVVSYNHVQVSTSRDFNPLTWIYSGGALPNQDQLSQQLDSLGLRTPGRRVGRSPRIRFLGSARRTSLSVQPFAAVTDRGQAVVTDPAYDLPETAPVLAFPRRPVSRYPAVARGRPVTVLCELLAKVPQVVVVTAQTDLPGSSRQPAPPTPDGLCFSRGHPDGRLARVATARCIPRPATDMAAWEVPRRAVAILCGRMPRSVRRVAAFRAIRTSRVTCPARGPSRNVQHHSRDERGATSVPRSHRPSRAVSRWSIGPC